jgi:lycopene beta-cyclase
MSISTDLVIVGGGLAGGLTALIFKAVHPDRKITLLEQGATIGGVRTWSFHESDVSPETLEILKPVLTKSWSETSVTFPKSTRTLTGGYHVIRSEDFARHLSEELGPAVKTESKSINSLTLSC